MSRSPIGKSRHWCDGLRAGRVPIYLLDPDLPDNSDADRALCAQLYGGDRETRLAQELPLRRRRGNCPARPRSFLPRYGI